KLSNSFLRKVSAPIVISLPKSFNTGSFGSSKMENPNISKNPSRQNPASMNNLYNPDFVCPFLFLSLGSLSTYTFLNSAPPFFIAFTVEPTLDLPTILLPSLCAVFKICQYSEKGTSGGHFPPSSTEDRNICSPSI